MAPAPTQSEATQTVEQSGAKHIRNLPEDQFELVVESLRDGVALDALVGFFEEQGWLTVSVKTFKQYLSAFRRVYPEFLRGEDPNSLNSIVSKRKPKLDEEQQLEQLIRVQTSRLRRGIAFEEQTNMTNVHLHKDIGAARELVESLAKLRGKGNTVGRPGPNSNQIMETTNAAKEQLRQLDQGEAAQDKLAGLFTKLAPLLHARQASDE